HTTSHCESNGDWCAEAANQILGVVDDLLCVVFRKASCLAQASAYVTTNLLHLMPHLGQHLLRLGYYSLLRRFHTVAHTAAEIFHLVFSFVKYVAHTASDAVA